MQDDPWNEVVGCNRLRQNANASIVRDSFQAVRDTLPSTSQTCNNDDEKVNIRAIRINRKSENVTGRLQAVLQLSGGMASQGKGVVFQRVRNTRAGGRRSYFLPLGRLIMIPGYTKRTCMKVNSSLVCWSPDALLSFLFKCFLLLVLPMHKALGALRCTTSSEPGSMMKSRQPSLDFVLSSKMGCLSAARAKAREWNKTGLYLTHQEYNQWNRGYARQRSESNHEIHAVYYKHLAKHEVHNGDEVDDCRRGIGNLGHIETALQHQAGHAKSTGTLHCGPDACGSAAHGTLCERKVSLFFTISEIWQFDTGLFGKNVHEFIFMCLEKSAAAAAPGSCRYLVEN